jgi:hypothetical protein
LLPNSQVLVAGGQDSGGNALASCEFYNPSSKTWQPAAAMNNVREAHTATLLPNGQVLVAGGDDPHHNSIVGTAELYDPGRSACGRQPAR